MLNSPLKPIIAAQTYRFSVQSQNWIPAGIFSFVLGTDGDKQRREIEPVCLLFNTMASERPRRIFLLSKTSSLVLMFFTFFVIFHFWGRRKQQLRSSTAMFRHIWTAMWSWLERIWWTVANNSLRCYLSAATIWNMRNCNVKRGRTEALVVQTHDWYVPNEALTANIWFAVKGASRTLKDGTCSAFCHRRIRLPR